MRQGTELRKTNEDEIRKEDANQLERSSSSSKTNVANANKSISRERQISRNLSDEGRRTSEARGESLQSEDRQTRTDNIRSSSEDVANAEGIESYVGEHRKHQTEGNGQSETRGERGEDVANAKRERLEGLSEQSSTIGKQDERLFFRNESSRGQTKRTEDDANTDRTRLQRLGSEHKLRNSEKEEQTSGDSWWQFEPDVGRVAHGVPGRVHRLKALGNSIVPKIAEEIGKAIMKAEREDTL